MAPHTDIPLVKATIISMALEGILYGKSYLTLPHLYASVDTVFIWAPVTASGSVWACSQASPEQGGIFFEQTGLWIKAFYSCTFSTNLFCTMLLAFRIWQINSRVKKHSGSSLMPVIVIIVDAAALYSVTLLSALLCFVNHTNGQYIVWDMVTPIISITFYMVIIR
ncbi:hypothetical protein EW146_g10498, partial [Bondarzewia mesenterica]